MYLGTHSVHRKIVMQQKEIYTNSHNGAFMFMKIASRGICAQEADYEVIFADHGIITRISHEPFAAGARIAFMSQYPKRHVAFSGTKGNSTSGNHGFEWHWLALLELDIANINTQVSECTRNTKVVGSAPTGDMVSFRSRFFFLFLYHFSTVIAILTTANLPQCSSWLDIYIYI